MASSEEADDVLVNSLYGVRTVELNRPKKLNSLNKSMASKILPRLQEWEKSDMANVIMITGAGEKAFCAGGDVATLATQNATKEGQKESTDFFALEYRLDHLIATYTKPFIAVMDGITMGGGVGLSVHAPFRIATERTVYAMPETTIGFFPDVGGSFALSRLDGEIGTYLALTSERLHGVQAFYAGIATHYIDSSVLAPMTTRLSELVFPDDMSLENRLDLVNRTMSEFTNNLPRPDTSEKTKFGNLTGILRQNIDECFGHDSVEDILAALEGKAQTESGDIAEWAKATLKTMSIRSPTSLKVTLKQLRLGKTWDIRQTFINEHRMAANFMAHPDFTEGVSARLINKPPTTPQWQPATLGEVTDGEVLRFFRKPTDVQPMQFAKRPVRHGHEIETTDGYNDYPHAKYALPRETDIEEAVSLVGRRGRGAVMEYIMSRWENKLGTKEKVNDVLARKTVAEDDGSITWPTDLTANL
jgi:3-hydroxyisobutyryl-CoA hydrolase